MLSPSLLMEAVLSMGEIHSLCSGEKEKAVILGALFKSTSNNFSNTEACDKKGQTHRCLLCHCLQCDPSSTACL